MSSRAENTEAITYVIDVAGNATAATPDEFPLMVVPFRGVVRRCRFIPKATVTGVATNNFAVTVRNRGNAGAGATNVASLTYANGTNTSAFASSDVTLAAAANLEVQAGDVLTSEKLVNGTGLAMPPGKLVVEIAPR